MRPSLTDPIVSGRTAVDSGLRTLAPPRVDPREMKRAIVLLLLGLGAGCRAGDRVNAALGTHVRGHDEQAVALLREEVAEHPDNARAHFNLGNLLMDLGRFEESRDAHRTAAYLYRPLSVPTTDDPYPEYQRSLDNLAAVESLLGNHEKAIELAAMAVVPGHDDNQPLQTTLRARLLLGQEAAARADLARLAHFEEQGPSPLRVMAEAALAGKLSREALAAYFRASAASAAPQRARALLAPAVAEAAGLAPVAELKRSLEDPAYPDKLRQSRQRRNDFLLARGLVASGQTGRGRAIAEQYLTKEPDNQAALDVVLMAKIAEKDDKGALAAVDAFLERNPRRAGAWYNKGVLHGNLGQLDQAESALHRALELNPVYPEANTQLARIAHRRGQPERALELARKQVALYPQDTMALYGIGKVEGERKRFAEAARAFQAIVDLTPYDHGTRLDLLESLRAAGDEPGVQRGCTAARDFLASIRSSAKVKKAFDDFCARP